MSKHFDNVDQYAGSIDEIWAMISEKGYYEGKYEALGASNLDWQTFNAGSDSISVSSIREVDANLPGFARKVIGDKAVITQTENWHRQGDHLVCEVGILTKGAPGGISGTMSIKPSGGGSEWDAHFDIKVAIPLLGKKFEGLAHDETVENFKKEKAFNDEWLASH